MKTLVKRLLRSVQRLSIDTKARIVQTFVNALRLMWEIYRAIRLNILDWS
jgi:hypothetical protein